MEGNAFGDSWHMARNFSRRWFVRDICIPLFRQSYDAHQHGHVEYPLPILLYIRQLFIAFRQRLPGIDELIDWRCVLQPYRSMGI